MHKILIVDDDDDLSSSLREFLKKKSHIVVTVDTATAAFQQLGETDFDLLILDWDLPDISGLEICKDYRERGGKSGVLMLTGKGTTMDKVAGLSAGADDYLVKPFAMAELAARVEALLRRAAAKPVVFDESFVGRIFANCYKIESVLGKGAMGIVYKAKHTTINRIAAIKVLSGCDIGVTVRMRFEREAKAMSLLDHPNLIKIYDFGVCNGGTSYIVMEFIEGMALNQVLKEFGPLPVSDAVQLFIQICEGLEKAHEIGIIHRDLKPANIMISCDGNHAKIVDFGVAKMTEAVEGNIDLTIAGEIFGSPAYMSPEQASGKAIDQRTDVYALACVMYEVLAGEMAYTAPSFAEVVNIKFNSKPPSICEKFAYAQFPEELDRIIRSGLQADPKNRQQSISEVKQQLEQLLQKQQEDAQSSPNRIFAIVRGLFNRKS